jgi:hypothetical protein
VFIGILSRGVHQERVSNDDEQGTYGLIGQLHPSGDLVQAAPDAVGADHAVVADGVSMYTSKSPG